MDQFYEDDAKQFSIESSEQLKVTRRRIYFGNALGTTRSTFVKQLDLCVVFAFR
jgi:hypothetical protein